MEGSPSLSQISGKTERGDGRYCRARCFKNGGSGKLPNRIILLTPSVLELGECELVTRFLE